MGYHPMEVSPYPYDLTDLFESFDDVNDACTFDGSDLFDQLSEDSTSGRHCGAHFQLHNDIVNDLEDLTDTSLLNEADLSPALSPDVFCLLNQLSTDAESNEDDERLSIFDSTSTISYNDAHSMKFSGREAGKIEKCKKPRKRKSQRKSVRLFEFLYHYLNSKPSTCVEWVDETAGVFRLIDNKQVAELWGKYKNNKKMTYESLSRGLRHYYRRGIFERMSQKLHYRFVPRAIELCKQSRLHL